jgi:hypothetical protein
LRPLWVGLKSWLVCEAQCYGVNEWLDMFNIYESLDGYCCLVLL